MTPDREALLAFIVDTEQRFFRTHQDTGATPNTLLVWNQLRGFAGLPKLTRLDLVQRARATHADDALRAAARGNEASADRARRAWAELDAILTSPDPEAALDDHNQALRDMQRAGGAR